MRKRDRGGFSRMLLGAVAVFALCLGGPAFADPTNCVAPPSGLISWWPGNGNATDIAGGNNGALMNGASFATGLVSSAFVFNGANQLVQVPDNPSLSPVSALTLEAWVYVSAYSGNDAVVIASKEDPYGARQYQLAMVN